MKLILAYLANLLILVPNAAHALQVGYALTITTAYSSGDPFPDRIDQNFNEPDDGFFQVANTGTTSFTGVIGTIAVSSFAGDLSWQSGTLTLAPNQSVSIAIPDNSSAVGGFNGPYDFYRPGVEITLTGVVSDATGSEPITLLVADRDIHSSIYRVDPFGLVTDSFVLQGGDPWGFNNGTDFALSQAYGVYMFSQTVPAPALPFLPILAIISRLALSRGIRRQPCATTQKS